MESRYRPFLRFFYSRSFHLSNPKLLDFHLALHTSVSPTMHVRPAVSSDLSATSTLSVSGCWDDELVEWLNPYRAQYPENFRDSFLQKHRMRYWSADYHFYVAETDQEDKDWSGEPQVTGYAIWQRRGNNEAAKAWQKWSWRAGESLLYCCLGARPKLIIFHL